MAVKYGSAPQVPAVLEIPTPLETKVVDDIANNIEKDLFLQMYIQLKKISLYLSNITEISISDSEIDGEDI